MALKVGDNCKLRGNDYMWCRIKRILPKGSHGKKCVLAECECSTDRGGKFGLIKTLRLSDLRAA
jgi:hypothetical protein